MSERTSSNSSLASSLAPVMSLTCLQDTPVPADRDWEELVVARVALWGQSTSSSIHNKAGVGEEEEHEKDNNTSNSNNMNDIDGDEDLDKKKEETCVAVQALLWQCKDGSQSGSAHGSVHKKHRSAMKEKWVMVQQPNGYVSRIEGVHSTIGSDCLLHSLRLEFASGQVIELQGAQDEWKGEGFVVEGLADNFYLSELVFEQGSCIGYKGYSTDVALAELMENEEPPDMERLELSSDDDDDSSDDGDNDNLKQQDLNKTMDMDDDDDDSPDNPDGWIGAHLKAKEIPEPESREEMMISHVCLCGEWAVHGLIFYYYDMHRTGYLLDNNQKNMSIYSNVSKRGGTFVDVEQPGGRLVAISGHRMTGADAPTYLCHSLKLEFESGQIIECHGGNDEWKGKYFSYDMPEDFYTNELHLSGGRLEGVTGVRAWTPPMDELAELVPPPIENRRPESAGGGGCMSSCLP